MANQQNHTPYHNGAIGGRGNSITPAYADQFSPVNNLGRKYVDVDSRLAIRVSEQIKKEKGQKPQIIDQSQAKSGGIKKETEE